MAFFQNSVLNKHLNIQDAETVTAAYQKFTAYFHNPNIQQNIKNAKEEQFQEGFLRELFVEILGYTLNPQPDFNLTTELKNERGAKKADGAILLNGKALGVIELKGTDTKDLDKINAQAFNYKNNHVGCVYVITSNFEKLRFFIHHSVEHLEFNLFTLTETEFRLLWLCLGAGNLLNGVPLKVKEESVLEDEKITKQLYKDYAAFRNDLWHNLVKNNPNHDKLLLFKKTQKLIDRFLFIFFAEDSGLLPPNSISIIIDKWNNDKDWGDQKSLYEIFKQYFGFINKGRPHRGERAEIFAYNGGLFATDETLENVIIDDEVLNQHTSKLTKYDFQSEVDVNILGHIFENSLNEIENITAQLEGQEVDKSKTKRKKDGVFYTPKYITKYIVDNTVGKLCEEKKAELGIVDEEYAKGRRNRKKEIIKQLDQNLQGYRNWLLNITICDPACGSGAFLNQALEFLMEEHAFIDELESQLLGHDFEFPGVENHILEKNIFGVDINEESVEIAKLSLWLRTAQRGRKLTSLNNNIKCGNSLIDDPTVAGDKAFNWEKEFPTVFAKGGFDVVVGNPPYVNINTLSQEIHQYFKSEYSTIHTGYNDLMYYFLYKGIDMLKKEGVFGVITSNYFIGNEYAKTLRGYLSTYVSEILNFGDYLIFEDANVHTTIIFAEKEQKNKIVKYRHLKNSKEILLNIEINRFETINKDRELLNEYWVFASKEKNQIIEKIAAKGKLLGQIAEIEKGSTSGKNDVFTVSKATVAEHALESEILRKNVKNGDILKYQIHDRQTFLIYTDNNTEIEKYPNILNYLNDHKEALSNRNEVKKGSYDWWRMERPRRKEVYDANEKIIVPYRATNNRFAYDNERRFNDGGDIRVLLITDKNIQIKYVLGILNSNLIDWYYGFIGKPKGNAREYFNEPLAKIPIFVADNNMQNIITQLVDSITEKIKNYNELIENVVSLILNKFEIEKLTTKLQNWHELEFKEFLKELKKAKVQMSLSEEAEWMHYFNEQKQKAQAIKTEIEKTDREIDLMVYELYGLTEEEIGIVEQS